MTASSDSTPNDEMLILEAERRRQQAVVDVALDELELLFAEDLVHVHSTGLVHDKAQLLQHIARKRGFLAVERGPLDVRIDGDTAVLTGPITNHMRGKEGGPEIVMHGFATQVLRRTAGGWRFTNFQFTLCTES